MRKFTLMHAEKTTFTIETPTQAAPTASGPCAKEASMRQPPAIHTPAIANGHRRCVPGSAIRKRARKWARNDTRQATGTKHKARIDDAAQPIIAIARSIKLQGQEQLQGCELRCPDEQPRNREQHHPFDANSLLLHWVSMRARGRRVDTHETFLCACRAPREIRLAARAPRGFGCRRIEP